MPKFRKKPVVIEAMQWPGVTVDGLGRALDFDMWVSHKAAAAGVAVRISGQSLIIPTLEGHHEAKPGDWIICGVNGELYPCKPDIFAKTYEAA